MHIPENILEEILSRVDIVEIISGYIPLKRAGRNFRASCPFHHEKTPSFMVSSDKQIYHCFGCGAGGNAFNFLIQYERLEFPEAVEVLAKKAGVVLPEYKKEDAKTQSLSTSLYKINELAALFYEQLLNSSQGSHAKNYLLKRGINENSIQLFKLGFAPERWDSLINSLRAKNIGLALMEKAGLALAKESGGYYDRFRNRAIFPVFDVKSRVVGFGARVLDDTLPKYINSPETDVYTKGKNLYGLHLAKDAIRDEDSAVVVEGYLDFILPFQEGLHNIVASLGTALTTDQIRLINRYTHSLVVVYDADEAGQMATLRALDLAIDEEMDVRVVSLPSGADPDSFVRKNGINDFKAKINNAENLFDYKLRILKSRYSTAKAEGKAQISSEMLPTINRFRNAVLKSEYIKKLSEELNIKEDALLTQFNKLKENKGYPSSGIIDQNSRPNINPTEKLLIRIMLEDRGLISRLKGELSPEDFQDERAARVVSLIFGLAEKGQDIIPRDLINRLDDDLIRHFICESALAEVLPPENKEHIINDCVRRLKAERLKIKMQKLHEEIKATQRSGDRQRLQKLMQEFQCLIKK